MINAQELELYNQEHIGSDTWLNVEGAIVGTRLLRYSDIRHIPNVVDTYNLWVDGEIIKVCWEKAHWLLHALGGCMIRPGEFQQLLQCATQESTLTEREKSHLYNMVNNVGHSEHLDTHTSRNQYSKYILFRNHSITDRLAAGEKSSVSPRAQISGRLTFEQFIAGEVSGLYVPGRTGPIFYDGPTDGGVLAWRVIHDHIIYSFNNLFAEKIGVRCVYDKR